MNFVLFPDLRPPQTVELYAQQIFNNLDVTENTRKEYVYRIRLFQEYIQKFGFNKNSYLEFKRYLQSRNDLSISSKNKFLIVSRIYLRELHRLGVLSIDTTAGVKTFKESRKHKRDGMSETEVQAIVTYLHHLFPTPHNMRVKAILCLLILQGLRQCEIIRLNSTDLDLVSGRMLILGKGRDDKEFIDLHPETVKVLKQYLQISKIADGALFTSSSNNSKNQRLTTKSIRNLINPILHELGIEKTVHGFRHYFVTRLVKAYKGDLLEICRYTRHRSIETLQIYNDNIKRKSDLPRYYSTFENIILS
jgi:integrase/recombinase XerC